MRRIVMWLVLAAIGLLIAASVHGAFLGAADAKTFFNSAGMIAVWVALALVLTAGFVIYPRLLKSPAALGMHLGSLLVLLGAMWGSDYAHELRREWLGSEKVPGGYMFIEEGGESDAITDGRASNVIGRLPFAIALKDFRIEYYPDEGRPWNLFVVTPEIDADGNLVREHQDAVEWGPAGLSQPIAIPHTPATVRVLQYLPHASPVMDEGAEPFLRIVPPGGAAVRLAAEVGREARLAAPEMTIRVVRIFQNLKVQGPGDQRTVTDAPGEGSNPAVQVAIEQPGVEPVTRYLFLHMPQHGQTPGGVWMQLVHPAPTGARADPHSALPAMQVRLESGGRSRDDWFIPAAGQDFVGMQLADIIAATPRERELIRNQAALYLVRPKPQISDYFSDLVVREGGKTVQEKSIEVNDPLHYGGYHFYQADYDHDREQYTVLSVSSDSGLMAVWIGLTTLVASAFWRFWGEPVWRFFARSYVAESPGIEE